MIINFTHYLQNLQLNFQRGSERSHYPTLKALMDDSMMGINAVIEEKGNQAGIPDFTVRKNGQLVGYIEAKDINRNLDIEEKTEQLERYRESSVGQNLILTNYLEFRWYLDGKLKQQAAIAYLEKDIIVAYEKTEEVVQLLQLFLGYKANKNLIMIVNFTHYLQSLQVNFRRGSERSHYPKLKELIDSMMMGIDAVIEEKKGSGNGKDIPDFTVRKYGQLVGHIEAKNMKKNLDKEEKTEQLERYRESSVGQNLILTNYLEFRWYVDGKLKQKAAIAYLEKDIIVAYEKTEEVVQLLQLFLGYKSYYDLAKSMADYTKSIRYSIKEALKSEKKVRKLTQIKLSFRDLLLPDLNNDDFADMYAETIAYSLFMARVGHAKSSGKDLYLFNRKTASRFIGNTIPLVQGLFDSIVATNMVSKIQWSIDSLVDFFIQVDMERILESFSEKIQNQDPIVDFYNCFLRSYKTESELALRKSRGVDSTPEPVVTFIVQAVNDILDMDFDLPFGLGNRQVMILEPATGTGTFLYGVIKQVYRNFEKSGVNKWDLFLRENKLLKRLYGFELLMTPYIIAHLKLALLLERIGYKLQPEERLNIYLTNTLEKSIKKSNFMVDQFIIDELNQSLEIKEKMITVILGNPPCSFNSQNSSKRERVINEDTQYLADIKYNGCEWEKVYRTGKAGETITELTYIGELLEVYKGRVRLDQANNIRPLDDDYIKFIRFAQYSTLD